MLPCVIHHPLSLIVTGRGTSAMEGLSVAWAVMEHLHDIIGIVYVCIFM